MSVAPVKAENRQLVAEKLVATVKSVTFHNAETGYCILGVLIPGRKKPETVVGNVPSITAGVEVECFGEWAQHPRHGNQFKAKQLIVRPPSTKAGVIKYLSSIPNVGPKNAAALVEALGVEAPRLIREQPHLLKNVKGIGPKRRASIIQSATEHEVMEKVMVFLHQHGVGAGRATAIIKKYGENAEAVIKANPYRLIRDIEGIGFKIADDIAKKAGIPHDSEARARAGLMHVLSNMTKSGHCAVSKDALLEAARVELGVPLQHIAVALGGCLRDGEVIQAHLDNVPHIYPKRLFYAEGSVAQHVARIRSSACRWKHVKADHAVEQAETRLGITLSDEQREAVRSAITEKLLVITGGPGVGKTTIVRAFLDAIAATGAEIKLCAPTGLAAKKMAQATDREASTIHALLKPSNRGFLHNQENPITADLLVIDEFSMVDIQLAQSLLQAVPAHCAVIIVGDKDQLPSVAPGAVLSDLISSEVIPTVKLTKIYRQAANSNIIINAHRINEGKDVIPQVAGEKTDFYVFHVEKETEDEASSVVAERIANFVYKLVLKSIPERFGFDAKQDIQVLAPMHKGPTGTEAINATLQRYLNGGDKPSLVRFGVQYAVGDRVIITKPNSEKGVVNGDVGEIQHVDQENKRLTIGIDDRGVVYTESELDEVSLAYCLSIHKSQGSEYPVLVIPMSTSHSIMLERQLFYTGVTRGRQLVVVVGEKKAINRAIKNVVSRTRKTDLAERVRKACLSESSEQEVS